MQTGVQCVTLTLSVVQGAVSCSTVHALPCMGQCLDTMCPITGMPRQGRRQRHTVPDRYLFLPVQKGSSLPGSVVKYCSRRANQYPPFSRQQKAAHERASFCYRTSHFPSELFQTTDRRRGYCTLGTARQRSLEQACILISRLLICILMTSCG
jgi:hypothetical protein